MPGRSQRGSRRWRHGRDGARSGWDEDRLEGVAEADRRRRWVLSAWHGRKRRKGSHVARRWRWRGSRKVADGFPKDSEPVRGAGCRENPEDDSAYLLRSQTPPRSYLSE